MFKYGVKFCGGCNPTFERGELFRRIKEATCKHIYFENVKEDEIYDGLLIICGCDTCCVDMDAIQTKTGPIFLGDESDYERVLNQLNTSIL